MSYSNTPKSIIFRPTGTTFQPSVAPKSLKKDYVYSESKHKDISSNTSEHSRGFDGAQYTDEDFSEFYQGEHFVDRGREMVDMKSIFFAERALVHTREHEREIRSTLEEFGVRNYTICAGFNEDYLSKRQHLEEINIRIYESIHASKDISLLLDSLGKIFFPFHGSVYVGDSKLIQIPISNSHDICQSDWHSTIVSHWPITITLGPKNNRGEIPGASLDMGLDSLSILGRSENPGEKGSRLGGNEDDKARGLKKCPTVSFRVSAEHPVPNPDKKTQNIEIYSGSMTTMSVAFAYPELVQSTHGMGKVTIEFRELNFHHKSIGHDMYYLAAVVVLVKPKDTYPVSGIYYEDSYIRPDDGDKSTSSLAVNNSWFISSRSRVAERSVEWIFRRIGNGSGQQGVDLPKRDFWSLLNPKDRDIEVDLPKMGFEFLLNSKDQLYVNIKVVSYWSLVARVPEGISKTCLSNFCQIGNFKIPLKSVIQTQRIERHYTSPGNSRLDYSRFDEYIDSATVTITPTRFHAGTPVQSTARDFFEPQLGTSFISKKIENITGGLELMGSKYSNIINVPLPNEEIIPERDSFSTLKPPISNEVNCSQQLKGFIDLIYAGDTEEISWQSLFYAKRSFKHAIQKEAIIRSILFYFKIESCTICAGFNEFLISNGGGHLEEISIYIDKSTQVDPGRVPSLLNLLGDVFSPFPGLIYIGDSDPIPTPVLNEYGSQRDHDDIYFKGIDQIGDRQSNGTRPIILTCNNSNGNEQTNTTNDKGEGSDSAAEDPPEGEGSGGGQNPPPGSSGRGNSENEDNYGGGSGDRKKGTSKAQKAVSPKVHFSIDALISDGETEYDTLKHIGTLSMRVGLNFQVNDKYSAEIKFTRLTLQQIARPPYPHQQVPNLGTQCYYHLTKVKAFVDCKDIRATFIRILPNTTPYGNDEVQKTKNKGTLKMVSAMLSLGSKISANLGGGKTHTQANQDQYKTYTSPITAREFEGRVEWIFDIEDENKQMRGDNILDDKLPEANFEFWDPSDDEPKSFAVKVSSYWSPASGKSRLSGIWLSNVCQIGEIEIPYNLSKVTRGYVKKYTWKEPNGISIPNGIERNTTGDARVMFTPGISSYEP